MAEPKIFQFQPFNSFVSPTFWHKLAEIKIDVDRLSDVRRPINGFYTNSDATHCLLEADATSFNRFVNFFYTPRDFFQSKLINLLICIFFDTLESSIRLQIFTNVTVQ